MSAFGRFAARDAAIIAIVALAWWMLVSVSAGEGLLADLVGVVLGLGFGLCTFLLHEWGHLLGALATRSRVLPPDRLGSGYLFSFDSQANSRSQFLVMSFSGFVVTGLAIVCALGPLHEPLLAARVARGAIAFLASLTVFIEFPLVIYSLVTSRLPPIEVFEARTES
jgi:hypothetical protein